MYLHAMKNKKFGILLFLSLIAMVFTFTNFKPKENSKEVASKFLNALYSKKYEEAKKYSSSETIKMLDMFISVESMLPDSVKNAPPEIINIIGYKEEKSSSVVTYTASTNPELKKTLKLELKDKKWLVLMTKEDEMEQYSESDK